MGWIPELMVYPHKIGDIYGKKNLKVPTQNTALPKSEESFLKAVNSIMKIREVIRRSGIVGA